MDGGDIARGVRCGTWGRVGDVRTRADQIHAENQPNGVSVVSNPTTIGYMLLKFRDTTVRARSFIAGLRQQAGRHLCHFQRL